ncbi:MAG: IS630 family transposase, partial [Bacteroidota bacterium]
GSWLNVAECELSVLSSQCLDRRIATLEEMKKQEYAWQNDRNNRNATIDWQFQDKEARIKLRHLYPNI